MAEIKVQIKGDDSDFKAKLAESGAHAKHFGEEVKKSMGEAGGEAKHFSEQVKESFDKVKEASTDIMKDTGLGGIAKLLGMAGAAGAAVEFGSKIVEAFKEGIGGAIKMESAIAHLKLALGSAREGMAEDLVKFAEANAGAVGSVEENISALKKLTGAGMTVVDAQKALIDLQNAALKTDQPLEKIADDFAAIKAEGEVRPGFFRENPEIALKARQMLGLAPPQGVELTPEQEARRSELAAQLAIPTRLPSQIEENRARQAELAALPMPSAGGGVFTAADEESLVAKVKEAGGASWMLKKLLPQIAPGGATSPVRGAIEETEEGKLKDLSAAYEKLTTEIGEALLPTMKDFTGWLTKEIPIISEDLKAFAAALNAILESLKTFAPAFTAAKPGQYGTAMGAGAPQVGSPFDPSVIWKSIGQGLQDSLKPLNSASTKLDESATKIDRALNPKS